MKLTTFAAAAMTAAFLGSPAMAQGLGHKGTELTLGYDSWDVDVFFGSGSGSTSIARVRTDWGFGPNFGGQINLDYASFDFDNGPSTDSLTVALHPYWEFGSMGRAGLFYQTTDLDNVDDVKYFGVEGMLTPSPGLAFEGYAGRGDSNDLAGDITTFGMSVHYAFSDTVGMRIVYDYEELSDGPFSVNNSRFNFGVDYHIRGTGSLPDIVLTGEVGNVDIAGFVDLTVIGAKVTIPLGGSQGARGRKLFRERGIIWAAGDVGLIGGPIIDGPALIN